MSSLSPDARAPLSSAELDARILIAEQAVMARDVRVGQQLRDLGARMQRRAARGLRSSLAGLAGSLLMSRLLPARRASRTQAPAWPKVLSLLWPALPARWRMRTDPATVALVVELLLPWLQRRRAQSPPEPALQVDLQRCAGEWFEIARLAHGGDHEGAPVITILPHGQRELTLLRFRRLASGHQRIERGRARIRDARRSACLELTFAPEWLRWLPVAWRRHWILDVDPGYAHAVIGTPDRRSLWLLSRDPEPGEEALRRMVRVAHDRGYDAARLRARQG
jgi:apolipoprotein D and lipocalin family protein